MLHILSTAVNAVMPIILLILLGYFLKQKGFLSKDFLKMGNSLVFKVCLPAMLFVNVYDIDGLAAIRWDIVMYCVVIVAVIFVLGLLTAVLTTKVPERRGVILQCTFRSNFAIIGLSLAGALGGDGAMAVAAIVSAFTIPVFNILAVIALSVFVGGGKPDVKKILLNIVKNPLIIGVVAGLVCLGIRALQEQIFGHVVFALNDQTKFLYKALSNLKAIASPFALLVLGGQFEFSAVKGLFKEIVVGTAWRIVLAPLLGVGCAVVLTELGVLSFGANEFPALIALFGSPVAVSSAIMAGSMGNDEQLATQLVVWTSICSIVTIFAQVCLLMAMGLLMV
ncbi:MAG: AEC family transporter [Oscillospiraceae bacterium]|nr:AEC family transporter [Oscillospiraceae bacterium]